MDNIRPIDMLFLDDVFEMNQGYVLDFSDRTFAQFFSGELNVDIQDPIYAQGGTSKAKRLRYFLQTIPKPMVIRTLLVLWEYREDHRKRRDRKEVVKNATGRLQALIERIEGQLDSSLLPEWDEPTDSNKSLLVQAKGNFDQMTSLAPQPRGYAFETFLIELFDAHNLAAKKPFKLKGEQIDGSFQFDSETYLIEAKWQSAPVGVADLHTFHGKIEQKATWARGLFVSISGFSADGLAAFGSGKKLICMDGCDFAEMFDQEISLIQILRSKVRQAAETGSPFIRVRDLLASGLVTRGHDS